MKPLEKLLKVNSLKGTYQSSRITNATSDQKEIANMLAPELEKILKRASSEAIGGHIMLMLRHYYHDASVPAAVSEGLALQWIAVLEKFPEWAVKKAVTDYLASDTKGRKPVPGQIRERCEKSVARYLALSDVCYQIKNAPLLDSPENQDPNEREAAKARVSAMLEEARKNIKRIPV